MTVEYAEKLMGYLEHWCEFVDNEQDYDEATELYNEIGKWIAEHTNTPLGKVLAKDYTKIADETDYRPIDTNLKDPKPIDTNLKDPKPIDTTWHDDFEQDYADGFAYYNPFENSEY